jgi:colanic acid/amylovoran biosynthesis glycosyltransferase
VTAVAGRIALVGSETADLRGLREAGWDARLLDPDSCRRHAARLRTGLALARAATVSPRAARRALRVPREVPRVWCRRQVATRLVAARPQVVHFDSARSAAAWLPVLDALDGAVVVGLTAEDLYGSGSAPFPGCEAVWARAAAVHVPDRALERRALQRGLPPDLPRAVVVPAVEATFFATAEAEPAERRSGALRIVSADSLDWMQGFEHAIHAVRLLRDAGVEVEYTIVGDGDYLPALTFARHQLDVADEVRFSGALAPDELRDRLRSADVFLGASVVDGLPRGALRALACGTPAVLSDPGPLGEPGLDGAALIAPRRKPEALAEKLAALAADEELRRGMGRAARAWALEHASATDRRDRLERLLRQALAQ